MRQRCILVGSLSPARRPKIVYARGGVVCSVVGSAETAGLGINGLDDWSVKDPTITDVFYTLHVGQH